MGVGLVAQVVTVVVVVGGSRGSYGSRGSWGSRGGYGVVVSW